MTQPLFTIRPAAPPDVEAAMAILASCIASMRAHGLDQWDERYPAREDIDRDIAAGTLFLALHAAAPIGMITLNETQPPEYRPIPWLYTAGRIAVLHRLAVHADFQGRGIASRLMAFAEAAARQRGYAAIRLDAFVHNPAALGLYTRRDYRRAGIVRFRKGEFFCFEKNLASPMAPTAGEPGNA